MKTAGLESKNKTRHPVLGHSLWVTVCCAMSAIIGAVRPFVFKSCLGLTKNCDKGALHLHLGKIFKGLCRTNGGDQVSCGSSNAKNTLTLALAWLEQPFGNASSARNRDIGGPLNAHYCPLSISYYGDRSNKKCTGVIPSIWTSMQSENRQDTSAAK